MSMGCRHFSQKKEVIKIVANHSKFANVVEKDILTTNGVFHIVDMVLEPFLPNENQPTLEDVLQSSANYSIFYKFLQETGLLQEISAMDEYTVFVPTNEAFGTTTFHLSASALKYYVVPRLLFTPSVYNHQVVDTLLGPSHKLLLSIEGDKVMVNEERLLRHDVLIDGGVIHEIGHRLHTVLNVCNSSDVFTSYGSCSDCNQNATDMPCPEGFTPFVPARILHWKCVLGYGADTWSYGCKQLCARIEDELVCCAGFFGPRCEECPGGAEVPCSGHGTCADSFSGNGTCRCDPNFAGEDCSQCEDRSMALPYCNTTHPSCEREESGCHLHALCEANHAGPAQCTCQPGYHGDGREACEKNVDPCQEKTRGGCDAQDRATCRYLTPKVTDLEDGLADCECLDGFLGNGTLCSRDVLDSVSRIPQLAYFRNRLGRSEDVVNVTVLLANMDQNLTLFAPLSQNYVTLSFPDLVLMGEALWLPSDLIAVPQPLTKGDDSAQQQLLVDSVTALGGQKINITVDSDGQLFANDVRIVEKNIETPNGLVHLTESPISAYEAIKASPSTSKGQSDMTIILVCVVAIVLIVIIVVVVVILFVRSKKSGFLGIFKRKRSSSESETNVSFARLSAQEEDDDSSFKTTDSAKYDNPIFDDPDLL